MNTHLEILVKELIKNGVSAKCCEIITDNEGNVSASEPFLDFSEHDKMVSKEKDSQMALLENINKAWIGVAERFSVENMELIKKVEILEAIIADGKKPDISVSENGVSVGCECGGYHLAKERIEVLEKENSELDHMRKSWMETAQKWSKLNSELQDKIAKLECSSKIISELEDQHQSDCIRINQLLTTIDVLTERYQKLREIHGL